MPIEVASGALRLKPSLRVRLHGRSRAPEIAVAMSLTTMIGFFGVALLAPTNAQTASAGSEQPEIVEVRSAAAAGDGTIPVRRDIRVISLESGSMEKGATGWSTDKQ